MAKKTCFVIMPIGDQVLSDGKVSAAELRLQYDDLIKEAIIRADPEIEVTRADDVALPGSVTTDIIARLMHSEFVVADITYPNPNVFYELGLRHACHVGTVIIRERTGPKVPFDVAQLRYIEYENTATGLKKLAEELRQYFDHFRRNPYSADSHFQEYARLTQYRFPDYSPGDEDPTTEVILAALQSPDVMELMLRSARGEEIRQEETFKALLSDPGITQKIVSALVKTGQVSLGTGKDTSARTSRRRKKN